MQIRVRVRVRVRVQKGRNLTGSGILGLKKACQVEHGTTQTLLLQQVLEYGNTFGWGMSPSDP